MTETPLQQTARAHRSLQRLGSIRAVLGGSPLESAAIENITAAVLFFVTPRGKGGRQTETASVALYEAAHCYERPDGTVADADLQRIADELQLPVSRKPKKLADRYKAGRDDAEQQAASAWIKTNDAAQEHIRRAIAEIEAREAAVTEREREVGELYAEARRKLEQAREWKAEALLASNTPLTQSKTTSRD